MLLAHRNKAASKAAGSSMDPAVFFCPPPPVLRFGYCRITLAAVLGSAPPSLPFQGQKNRASPFVSLHIAID
ncbi:hypothetical protein GCM10010911_56850 [Paenibacillus nasutitermitis]|uniref:Uncharacterized protein n=1 Tax=Paenibacillus nasutitermitis TaxID=1652958 RepID=A0A917E1P2_9BACL|nr:hypothetical protein GCM10010911_56850 [Paenibacillus nasutitermitis]